MSHPNLKHGYHAIQTKNPPKSKEIIEMFIGRFKTDNKYPLLGYRPQSISYMFSEASETNQDLGAIQLPKNKKLLTQLVQDEIFFINPKEGKTYHVKYISHS